MIRRNLLLLIIIFCSGIITSRYLSVGPDIWMLMTGGIILLILGQFMFGWTDIKWIGRSLLVCAFIVGAFWYALSQYPAEIQKDLDGLTFIGEGMVITYAKEGDYSLSFVIRVNELKTGEDKLLYLDKLQIKVQDGDSNAFPPGTIVQFRGVAQNPTGRRNPGGFDYSSYLANQGIFYQVSCSAESLQIREKSSGLRGAAAHGRQKIYVYVEELLPDRESGLLLGFLFGDTTGITDEEWEVYQRAGVLHLFAISGLHVSLMLGVAYFLLSFILDGPLSRVICGTVVLIIYYFLIGWKVSFVRAAIMVFLGMAALLTGRKKDIYTSAALAVGVILLVSPGEIFQMGFQMSFAATVGIVYYSGYLESYGLGRYLSSALAAQITTIPLIAYYFNLLSLVAPLLNIVAVMASTIIAGLGLAGALFVCLAPVLAKPFILAAGFLLFLLSELILWVASCSWAAWVVPTPSLLFVIILYVAIIFVPQARRCLPYISYLMVRYKTVVIPGLIFLLIIVIWPQAAKMEVVFLDVGQGDCIFVRTQSGRTMLVDGGGTPSNDYSIGKKVVRPFLIKEGLEKIDVMVMSHNHLDHSEGLLELIPHLHVGCFMMPPLEGNNEMEDEIMRCCSRYGTPIRELEAGERVYLEKDVYMEILHPEAGNTDIGNNHSLVLRLVYKEVEWLLTGDIENDAVEKIINRGVPLKADIMKLPHHGSISSYYPQFYKEVDPRAVVVSVGYNLFNQPHPKVREYFDGKGIPFYSTKDNGAVITESDGHQIWLRTMKY